MLDLAAVRVDPERFRKGLAAKGVPPERVKALLDLDTRYRAALHEMEKRRALQNTVSKSIGEAKKGGNPAAVEGAALDMRLLKEDLASLEKQVAALEPEMESALLALPNIPDPDVPVGTDASSNRVERIEGEPVKHPFAAKPHWEIAERLQIADWERGGKVSGSRFYFLKGDGARLERALLDWMVDTHVADHGYTELRVPLLILPEALVGTGQLPTHEENMYRVRDGEHYLIPTSEVPIVNFHREEVLPAASLPLRYTAHSANFRREAGAAGRQTRGFVRGHQFYKVEMVQIVRPEASDEALVQMLGHAEAVLRALGLAYRVLLLCSGDLSVAAAKCYDIEAWAPGIGEWLEVSSVSNCRDFQARRARIRFKEEGGKPRPVHTLNGTGVAVPRTIAAILETFQRPDGSVTIPLPLRPWFDGRDTLVPPA